MGFEEAVRRYFDDQGQPLQDYTSSLRDTVTAHDGEYEIDIEASFLAMGVRIRVLIECKHHGRRVKREAVMVLNQRLQSCGAHKGIVVAAHGFQSGAIEFAKRHGIALFEMGDSGIARILEASGCAVHAIPPYEIVRIVPLSDSDVPA